MTNNTYILLQTLLVSDNVLDTGKKTKSSGGRIEKKTGWGEFGGGEKEVIEGQPGKGDVGDFSRYYSLDEWWKFRMSRLPEEIQRTFPFLVVPKASKSEKNMGLDKLEKQQKIFNGQVLWKYFSARTAPMSGNISKSTILVLEKL